MRKKEEGQHVVRDVARRQKQEKAREKELEEAVEEGVLDKTREVAAFAAELRAVKEAEEEKGRRFEEEEENERRRAEEEEDRRIEEEQRMKAEEERIRLEEEEEKLKEQEWLKGEEEERRRQERLKIEDDERYEDLKEETEVILRLEKEERGRQAEAAGLRRQREEEKDREAEAEVPKRVGQKQADDETMARIQSNAKKIIKRPPYIDPWIKKMAGKFLGFFGIRKPERNYWEQPETLRLPSNKRGDGDLNIDAGSADREEPIDQDSRFCKMLMLLSCFYLNPVSAIDGYKMLMFHDITQHHLLQLLQT